MPDHLPSAVETISVDSAAERANVCLECTNARSALLAELSAEQVIVGAEQTQELAAWVAISFPELQPTEQVVMAAQAFQAEEREFDPEYDVTTDDPEMTKVDICLLMEQQMLQARNANTSGEIHEGIPAKVPADADTESQILTEENALQAAQSTLNEQHADLEAEKTEHNAIDAIETARTDELGQLQEAFNQLRNDGLETAVALGQVISQANDPATKQRLNAILGKVALLQTALPNKPEVVRHLLNTTGLNLAALTLAGSFTEFMAAAETNDELTDQDRANLRRIVNSGELRLRTGTQIRETALRTAADPTTGEEKPIHTKDNKAEIAPGVFTYTATGSDVILEFHEGSLHRQVDVTGLDGQSIGIVAEIMGLSALAETCGASGFMKHVYDVDFDRITEQRFDPITLRGLSQKLSYLLGTGHDGEISQPVQRRQLLRNQMRLVSPTGSLLAWEDDPDGYNEGAGQLGLDHNAVLEEFGVYTQLHSGHAIISRNKLQRHLSSRFPDVVSEPIECDERDFTM